MLKTLGRVIKAKYKQQAKEELEEEIHYHLSASYEDGYADAMKDVIEGLDSLTDRFYIAQDLAGDDPDKSRDYELRIQALLVVRDKCIEAMELPDAR